VIFIVILTVLHLNTCRVIYDAVVRINMQEVPPCNKLHRRGCVIGGYNMGAPSPTVLDARAQSSREVPIGQLQRGANWAARGIDCTDSCGCGETLAVMFCLPELARELFAAVAVIA
jgi:hypothetical protein